MKGINENIKTDVYQAIGAAYNQGVRSVKRVISGKPFIKSMNGEETEIIIANTAIKHIICITAENFGIIPSEITKYIELDKSLNLVPYSVNIYDLDIITQECTSYHEFLDYLEFRENNHTLISTMDELDVFGFYKKHGNIKLKMSCDELLITDYTQLFDSKYSAKDKDFLQKYR